MSEPVQSAEALFHANIALAYRALQAAGIRGVKGERYDEMVADALVATWRACCNYDPDRGRALSTLVYHYVRNAVARRWTIWAVKPGGLTMSPKRERPVMYSPRYEIDDYRADTIQAVDDQDEREVQAANLRRMIDSRAAGLTPREACILRHVFDGKDYQSIAELEGISWRTVKDMKCAAVGKLRAAQRERDAFGRSA